MPAEGERPMLPGTQAKAMAAIGHGQTISQPYIVAFMTAQLAPKATDRVL